jgi:hypothetical protein
MELFQMNDEQLIDSLNSLLTLLDNQQAEIDAIQEKFQVALTGVLRLLGERTPTLTKLHGKTEDLKGYLIKLNAESNQSTAKSYQLIRERIEAIRELVSTSNRKS